MAFRGFIIALHIFAVIYWLGGLLMIASLLARVPEEVGLTKERLLGAARRLFEIGTNVGAATTIILGILLVMTEPAVVHQTWLGLKLLLVAILLFYHVRFYRRIRFLEDNPSQATHREFSFIHAAVSLLLIAILLVSILKPF
jgi:putative membrane protein